MKSKVKHQRIVVDGFLMHKGKVLIARRTKKEKFLPGYYELPGGKIEPGETPEQAIQREFKEEMGLKVSVLKPLYAYSYITDKGQRQTVAIVYSLRMMDAKAKIRLDYSHDDFQWVALNDIKNLRLTEEARAIIKLGLNERN